MSQGETMSHYTLQFFKYEHLPQELQASSKPFHDLAHLMDRLLDPSIEKEVMLRRLLEAKDCAVRAALLDKDNHEHAQLVDKLSRELFPHLFRDDNSEVKPDNHHTS